MRLFLTFSNFIGRNSSNSVSKKSHFTGLWGSLKMSWKSPQKSSQEKIGNPEAPSSRNLKLDLLPVSSRRHRIFYRWSVRRWNRLKPVITRWFPLLTLNTSLQGAVDKQHESWRENFLFLPYMRKCASFPSGFSQIHCYFNLHKS